MRGWGLGEGVLVKMGFVYWLNRSEFCDTFLSGGVDLGGREGEGESREQRCKAGMHMP